MARKANKNVGVAIKSRLGEFRRKEEFRYSQQYIADKVGVSRQTINAIENGNYNPSLAMAYLLAKLFHIKIEDLFIFDIEKP